MSFISSIRDEIDELPPKTPRNHCFPYFRRLISEMASWIIDNHQTSPFARPRAFRSNEEKNLFLFFISLKFLVTSQLSVAAKRLITFLVYNLLNKLKRKWNVYESNKIRVEIN